MKNPYTKLQSDLFSEIPAGADPGHEEPRPAEPAVPENLEALCLERICPVCPAKAEADDLRLRGLAEMENFKRRLQRETEEKEKYACEAVIAELLPALDSLDLAIQYAQDKDSSLLQGVIMTRKLLLDAMKPHGLNPLGELGEAFDHEVHEHIRGKDICQFPTHPHK